MEFKSEKSFNLWLRDNAPNLEGYDRDRCGADHSLLIKKEFAPVGTRITYSKSDYKTHDYSVNYNVYYLSEEHDEVHNKLVENYNNHREYELILNK